MERVTGIGGVSFVAADDASMSRWYAEHLGLGHLDDPEGNADQRWEPAG